MSLELGCHCAETLKRGTETLNHEEPLKPQQDIMVILKSKMFSHSSQMGFFVKCYYLSIKRKGCYPKLKLKNILLAVATP